MEVGIDDIMQELGELKSFSWQGTKRERFTKDRWSDDKNCRPLKESKTTANALLTGRRQLDRTGRYKLIAVDLDNKSNWDEVIATYKALELPPSLTVATPSDGYHIFFWVLKDIPVQSISDDRHCEHFELKGDNSNITAPGSVFKDGATYKIVRVLHPAHLIPGKVYRLCKYKQEWRPPRLPSDFVPEPGDIDAMAQHLDERARRNPRGWQVRCPVHEDRRSSAVLFFSGWLWCSACGAKKLMVRRSR